ncbi:hypothetical protein [Edwardsiella anguillarum]|uniref:hypothetical protein n=1 Tax=Edwardsiella anguillarum TaxID=1821960 RepID=UPI0024B661C0|nr:hypothetical protein [Edwardsiella anguillarum]WHP81485.1 hypothetical protein MQ090_06395 [Edwardsiella anguillarum]WHQ18987.1 hypothetical protein MQ085_06415 [Edwardsiella anguillarum]WHQ26053.1 hypothetical protein MQ094_06415 [Edwardsiella anguillarum]WHQ29574.1 hypothetical protein MQ093_06420 [Edwardsiella anguillarum]
MAWIEIAKEPPPNSAAALFLFSHSARAALNDNAVSLTRVDYTEQINSADRRISEAKIILFSLNGYAISTF